MKNINIFTKLTLSIILTCFSTNPIIASKGYILNDPSVIRILDLLEQETINKTKEIEVYKIEIFQNIKDDKEDTYYENFLLKAGLFFGQNKNEYKKTMKNFTKQLSEIVNKLEDHLPIHKDKSKYSKECDILGKRFALRPLKYKSKSDSELLDIMKKINSYSDNKYLDAIQNISNIIEQNHQALKYTEDNADLDKEESDNFATKP